MSTLSDAQLWNRFANWPGASDRAGHMMRDLVARGIVPVDSEDVVMDVLRAMLVPGKAVPIEAAGLARARAAIDKALRSSYRHGLRVARGQFTHLPGEQRRVMPENAFAFRESVNVPAPLPMLDVSGAIRAALGELEQQLPAFLARSGLAVDQVEVRCRLEDSKDHDVYTMVLWVQKKGG